MKYARFAIAISILISSKYSWGQFDTSHMIDSLRQVIAQSPEDSNKVYAMLDLARYYALTDIQEAIKVMDDGRMLSETLNFRRGLRACHGMKGMLLMNTGDFKQSAIELERSLQLAYEANDQLDIARASGALGSMMQMQARYPEALDYNFKALKAFESGKDSIPLAGCLSNIGSIYQELEKYEDALIWLFKAKAIEEKIGHLEYLGNTISNIGTCESELGRKDNSLHYYEESYQIFVKIEDKIGQAEMLVNIGSILTSKGDFKQSYQKLNEALRLAQEQQAKYTLAACNLSLARTVFKIATQLTKEQIQEITKSNNLQALSQALTYADTSLTLNQELDNLSGLMQSYNIKSEILEKMGRMEEALYAHQKYSTFRDSIFHMDRDKKIAQTSMQYEFDKKTEAAKLEQQKKDIREKNIRNSIIVGLAATLIFLIVVLIQRNRISKEKKRSEELLLNILPEEVAEELKSKGEADAVLVEHVTVLFTDFKGFTSISANMGPKELVRDLHECFSAFDRIMEKYNMEKIKTIGDAYMAAGGLPTPNSTHAMDAVSAALEMAAFIEEGKKKKIAENLPYFEIRIGVHTGPVVAGIVGVKKFQYDIWGDTVNTASRMESSGEPGRVNISATTFDSIKEHFQCISRGKITAKGKGDMEMYFVEGRKQ